MAAEYPTAGIDRHFRESTKVLDLWYRALRSQDGIEVSCSDPEGVVRHLLALRDAAKDPDLDAIHVQVSPFHRHKIWLIKRGPP